MNKTYKFFSYLRIILYGLWRRQTKSHYKEQSKKILVIMDQVGVGDAICSLDAFYNLALHVQEEYELYIAVQPSVIHFLKESKSTFGVHVISLDLSREVKFTFSVFKENQHKLDAHHWYYIVSLNRIGNYMKLLLMGCHYDKMLGMEYIEQKHSLLEKFFEKQLEKYYCIYLHDTMHIMQVYTMIFKEFLHILTNEQKKVNYRFYQIPVLGKNPLQSIAGKYSIVCPSIAAQPDHPFAFRKWPIERIVEIVDFILESSSLSVCLCGVEADMIDNEYVESHVKDSSRIINMTGKTSFKEWIELIRGAKFVLGNDSGYIHLASYLGVQSFVLAGYWNYGRFLPYGNDYIENRSIPVNIRIPMVSCAGCSHRNVPCNLKKQCDMLIEREGVYKCIWDIDVKQVENQLLQSGVLS